MKATLNSKSVKLILSWMKTESQKKKRRRKKPAKKHETIKGKFFKAKIKKKLISEMAKIYEKKIPNHPLEELRQTLRNIH